MVAHVAPEAVHAGPIAALQTGDELTIDVDAGRLDVALSDEEIAERVLSYERPPRADERVDVAIQKYAKLVGSASEGAIAR
jgi:dihydroxy-acid dehydratase